jgi:hypothetical protein
MKNAIVTLITVAVISALSWVLHWAAPVLGLSNFVVFCVVAFVIMVSCGYLYDYLKARPSSDEHTRSQQ